MGQAAAESAVETVKAGGGGAADLLAAMDWSVLTVKMGQALLVLLLAWLGYRAAVTLTRRWEARVAEEEQEGLLTPRVQRTQTVAQLVRYVCLVGVALVAGLTVLNLFLPIGPLLAGVSVFGLALSFGAQSLVKDVISGTFIIAEGQYAVGDVIRVNNDTAGQVERMTLRVVVLRDVHGLVHIIPNGEIKQVSNLTKEWSRALIEIGVAYAEDVDRVIETLEELGRELWEDPDWRPLLIEEPVVPGVERFEDSAVVIRLMVKTLPLKQFEVMRELRRRIKNRFDERGIEIPYPHRTLYWGREQAPGAEAARRAAGAEADGAGAGEEAPGAEAAGRSSPAGGSS